jgi:fused signal recognition particle receptor
MFGFGKDKKKESAPAAEPEKKPGLFARLKSGLSRTRGSLTEGIADLVLGKRAIDDELLEELETQLLVADMGVEATQAIIDDLTQRVSRKQLGDSEALMAALREDMQAMLEPSSAPLQIALRYPGGRHQRCRQDHHHRQAGQAAAERGQVGDAGRG